MMEKDLFLLARSTPCIDQALLVCECVCVCVCVCVYMSEFRGLCMPEYVCTFTRMNVCLVCV